MKKISISLLAWTPQEDETAFSILQNLGVDYVELVPNRIYDTGTESKWDVVRLEYLFKKLKRYSLKPISLQSILYNKPELQLFGDEASRKSMIRHVSEAMDIGSRFGIGVYIFGSPKNKMLNGQKLDNAERIAVDVFRELGYIAKKKKSIICIEATPSIYGAEYLTTTSEVVNLVKKIDNDGIRVNVDIGAMLANKENKTSMLQEALPYTGHIHISEPNLKRLAIDQMRYHEEIAMALDNEGYEKGLSIEMLGGTANRNTKDLRNIIHFVKQVYGQQ